MANYIPQGWQSSPQGKLLYSQKVAEIEVVVQRHVRKFRLQSMPPDDLAQEARLAAAYAVDTYNSGRGSLIGYVHHLVYNALAMVAAECLAQRRTPHIEVIEKVAQYDCGKITHINERWVKRPCMHVEMDNRVEESTSWENENPEIAMLEAEDGTHRGSQLSEIAMRRAMNKATLSPDGKVVAQLMLSKPPQLAVLARNLTGQWGRITHTAIARHQEWTNKRANAALLELKQFTKTQNANKSAEDTHGIQQPE